MVKNLSQTGGDSNEKLKEGDVDRNPDIKKGRGVAAEKEDLDVEKELEDEEGGEDDNEYKEDSHMKEDKFDLTGDMKLSKK